MGPSPARSGNLEKYVFTGFLKNPAGMSLWQEAIRYHSVLPKSTEINEGCDHRLLRISPFRIV